MIKRLLCNKDKLENTLYTLSERFSIDKHKVNIYVYDLTKSLPASEWFVMFNLPFMLMTTEVSKYELFYKILLSTMFNL